MENLRYSFVIYLKRAVSEPGTISAAYSAFHDSSIGNQLAALFQCTLRKIPVGPISTLKNWNSKGRFVKRGEKAIWLCMPITGRKTAKDETTGEETTDIIRSLSGSPVGLFLRRPRARNTSPMLQALLGTGRKRLKR